MNKPPSCQGCPMYQDGTGFVPDEVVEGAPVFVLGQNPGEDEEKLGRPFVGKTGQEMMKTFFPAAGLIRGENVSIGNTIKCRWNHSNNLPTGKLLSTAIEHCRTQHLRIPKETRLLIAQGAIALKATQPGNNYSITDWRGFLIPGGYNESSSGEASKGQEPKGKQIRKSDLDVTSPA